MQHVPFLDLPQQFQNLREEIEPAIHAVLEKCDFVGGQAVRDFENAFADFCGVKYGVAVSNGTDAIFLALAALGVGPGDEVITVPNTFIATAAPITRIGATIKFVDVRPDTMNMDVERLERAITHKTKAILPVHLYGQPADMDAILHIAKQHELLVIEDAAQAHGAMYRRRRTGSMGDAACFSFYPGKNLGAFGDAGAVVTNNEAVAARIRILRDNGRTGKYEHADPGYNHRMDTLQAAVLGVKLKHLVKWNARRREIAAQYHAHFAGNENIRTVAEMQGVECVYHLFVVCVPHRDQVRNKLQQAGIQTGIHYPIPLHLQPAYQHLPYEQGHFPISEELAPQLLSLPIFPEMTDEQVDYVAVNLKKAVG